MAQRRSGEALTTLAHYIDHAWLKTIANGPGVWSSVPRPIYFLADGSEQAKRAISRIARFARERPGHLTNARLDRWPEIFGAQHARRASRDECFDVRALGLNASIFRLATVIRCAGFEGGTPVRHVRKARVFDDVP